MTYRVMSGRGRGLYSDSVNNNSRTSSATCCICAQHLNSTSNDTLHTRTVFHG